MARACKSLGVGEDDMPICPRPDANTVDESEVAERQRVDAACGWEIRVFGGRDLQPFRRDGVLSAHDWT